MRSTKAVRGRLNLLFFIRRLHNLLPCCPRALKLDAVLKCKCMRRARGVPQGGDSALRSCIMFLSDEAGHGAMSCCVDRNWTGGTEETLRDCSVDAMTATTASS